MDRVAAALADFVRTRKSGNAPYDRWAYGRDGARDVTRGATRQRDLLLQRPLRVCHAGFNFSDGWFHNLGVGLGSGDADVRRRGTPGGVATSRAIAAGSRRQAFARSTSIAPYMHDGSLATLRDVVEFYNRGGNRNPGSSGPPTAARARRRDDVDALVAFLRALNGEGYEDRPTAPFPSMRSKRKIPVTNASRRPAES